jgi:hypothetical protein
MQFKISITLVFLILLILNNTAYTQNEFPVILNYENSSGEKGISFFEYDGNQRMIKGWWQLLDSSRWSVNYYIYNAKDQLVEKYREFSDEITSSLKYEYNSQGIKIAEDFSRSDGVAGKSTFEYNRNGALVKIHCNKYSGWFDGEIVYTPGKNGNPKSGEIFRGNKKLGDIQFEYTKDGNLKIEKWITPNWSQTFDWEYARLPESYTISNVFIKENNRFQLAEENYSYNGETGGPSFFTYDNNGKLIQKTFVRSDSLKTITTYEYDKKGILQKSVRKYNNGSTTTFGYEYNKNRQLIRRNFNHSNGTKGSEHYFYSPDGTLQKAILQNFDNWLTGEIAFVSTKSGKLQKGTFKGEKFDAELNFEYDGFGNLIAITWNFSFGKSQIYQFCYTNFYK